MNSLMLNRKIIDILIGDVTIQKDELTFHMPYLSGSDLCSLSRTFGLVQTYNWGGGNKSRWQYMHDLLEYIIQKDSLSDFLKYLFELKRFEGNIVVSDYLEIQKIHKKMVQFVIEEINSILVFSGNELYKINNNFIIKDINENLIILDDNLEKIIDLPYILSLKERTTEDLINGYYDSVITKCRTLLEETFIFILEKKGISIDSKGNIRKLFSNVKSQLNMNQSSEFDKRVNELLSGLEKIVNSISDMRNINSDAHGVGTKRISISRREAELIINSTIVICTFILQVYESTINEVVSL